MLCKTWVIQKLIKDGKDQIDHSAIGDIVLFSKARIYLLFSHEEKDARLAAWKWANSEETEIYYSWNNWEYNWLDDIIEINQLNNTLSI